MWASLRALAGTAVMKAAATAAATAMTAAGGRAAVPGPHRTGGTLGDRDRQQRAVLPDGWTKTFTDHRLCAAIVDRLTFAGQIIETGTTSHRLAHARKSRGVAL